MTKEQLFRDYLVTMNKVYELRGDSDNIVNVEKKMKYFTQRSYTKEYLEQKCEYALRLYRVTSYFATEEGKKFKEDIDIQIKKLTAEREEYVEKTKDLVASFIKAWLGDEWGVHSFGNGSFEVGLKDEKGNMLFGHTFTIYYDGIFDKKKYLQMNYCCMCPFDLLKENNTRSRYLLGMGLFSTNKDKLEELKSMIGTHNNKMSAYYKELNKLEEVLRNPFQDEKEIA